MSTNTRRTIVGPLTWRQVPDLLKGDPRYPPSHRAHHLSRVRKALQWSAAPSWHAARSPTKQPSRFLDRPFNHQTIAELFDPLRASELRLKEKTLQNARSVCNFVADFFEVPRGIARTPLSEDCVRLRSLVPSERDIRELTPGLRYLSYIGVSPWAMTQEVRSDFERAVVEEFQHDHPQTTIRKFTRAWSKCVMLPGWPQVMLIKKTKPAELNIDWQDHRDLERKIDEYLACGKRSREPIPYESKCESAAETDFGIELCRPLSVRSAKNSKDSLRMVIWALIKDGVHREDLKDLSQLCGPRPYRRAMRTLTERAGGVVNRTVIARAVALYRLARHPGVLSKEDLGAVSALHRKYEASHREFLKTHEDRDQATLDKLDDPSVMDAFLGLPTLTKNQVLALRNRHTISCAYKIQRALILELWLCAPYRIGIFASIELDQIISMRLDSIERVLLRGPKKQPSNKRSPEHFLNEDTVSLLKLYLEEYRPLILAHNKCQTSSCLFPGRKGGPKSISALASQITKFVRRNTSLDNWHPHIMRKISPKIALDADPGALEVARRTGGWTSERMLREIYGQRVHRASQARYLELLESRRLSSIRTFTKPRPSKKGK